VKVFTLVTIPRPELYHNCTLFLETIRTGFPGSEIHVYGNKLTVEQNRELSKACCNLSISYEALSFKEHHARWIEKVVLQNTGRIAIIDPDTIWWENCETIKVPEPFLWAGHYIPAMWNEWAKCRSIARLHAEFVLIPDMVRLYDAIVSLNEVQYEEGGEYCQWEPFFPRVSFVGTMKVFHDTLSQLYSALPGWAFDEDVLNRYDHLNSAAFFDVMCQRVARVDGFKEIHRLAQDNPKALKGLWKEVNTYYTDCAAKFD